MEKRTIIDWTESQYQAEPMHNVTVRAYLGDEMEFQSLEDLKQATSKIAQEVYPHILDNYGTEATMLFQEDLESKYMHYLSKHGYIEELSNFIDYRENKREP